MAKVKALFYLPLRDNDGRDLAADIANLEFDAFVEFSGWTFLGYVKGAYRMADGTQALDESAAYFVVLEEDRIDDLARPLLDFKAGTLQQTIYLEFHRDVEIRFL